MAKTARQVVADAYEAMLGRGDIAGFVGYFAEDGVMIEAASLPYGGRHEGRAAIQAGIERVFEYWKDFAYEVENVVGDDTMVIAYGKFSATSIKTGSSVAFSLAEVFRIENGEIKSVEPIYSDTKLAVDALGLN